MSLPLIYWLCCGAGLAWVLLAGALGTLSHGFAGKHDTERNEDGGAGRAGRTRHYNPLSPVPFMGTLAGFGAGGLLAGQLGLNGNASFGGAAAGAVVMALVLWFVIGRLLRKLHERSAMHVSDMIGLQAEVLTPVEQTSSGEIAYELDGTRYTAPARLLHAGRVGKSQMVRISQVGDDVVYVEEGAGAAPG